MTRYQRVGLIVAAATIALDHLSKWFFTQIVWGKAPRCPGEFFPAQHIDVLPFFKFSQVCNKGVSFGLFSSESLLGRLALILFSLVISGFVAQWLWTSRRLLPAIALGLILGGALGNVIDRALFGHVFDFLDFSGLGFPWIFNVADSGITVGVALLVADVFFDKGARRGLPGERRVSGELQGKEKADGSEGPQATDAGGADGTRP